MTEVIIKHAKRGWWLLAGLMLGVMVVHAVTYVFTDRRVPIDVRSVKIVGPVVAGQMFILEVDRIKVRDCPSEWSLFFVDENQFQHTIDVSKAGSAVGVGDTVIRIPLVAPESLTPGIHIFKSLGKYTCGDGETAQVFTIRQPDILVRVQ